MAACHERPGNRAVAMIGAYVAIDAQETHQPPALSRVALLEVFGTLDAQRHYQQQCQQPRATSGGPKLEATSCRHSRHRKRNTPLVSDGQALSAMPHRIGAKRRHVALYETSCLIYG